MALSNRKITVYANPVANLPDHPSQTGFTAAQLKAAFDAIANEEVKTTINGIIDDLVAILDGASGADQVGATAISDLDGTTVQAILESIRNKLKSILDGSSGADFIGATSISNLDGTTVQALLESIRNKLKSTVDGSSGADFVMSTPLKAGGASTLRGQLLELVANITTVNTNEETRLLQEAARVTAEGARVTAETSRTNAETSRTNAESGRVTAENNRIAAEQVRVEADILRGQTVEAIEQNYAPRLTSAEEQINALDAEKANQTDLSQTNNDVNATNLRIDNLVIPISAENANIEVTDAHNSIVKNKNFLNLKARLEESEQDFDTHKQNFMSLSTVRATNMFENSKVESTLDFTGAGRRIHTNADGTWTQTTSTLFNPSYQTFEIIAGHKYFTKVKIKDSSVAYLGQTINILYNDNTKITFTAEAILPRRELVGIITADKSLLANVYFSNSTNSSYSNGVMNKEYQLFIDLTETFGEGKEPTAEEMEAILNDIGAPVGFDGYIDLYSAKEMYYMLAHLNDSEVPSYSFSTELLTGDYPDSDLLGIGDVSSPFDYTNDNHILVYGLFDQLMSVYPDYITKTQLGVVGGNIPIYSYNFTPTRAGNVVVTPYPKILIGSAIHGGEGIAVATLYYLFKRICEDWSTNEQLKYMRFNINFKVVPLQNPIDYDDKQYVGLDGININRNFDWNWEEQTDITKGPYPNSELETQIMRDFWLANTDAIHYIDCHVRGGRQTVTDDKIIWLNQISLSSCSVGATTIEQITRRWRAKYPQLPSIPFYGYGTIGVGTTNAHGYAHNVIGIESTVWEGFSASTTMQPVECKDVVDMNVDCLGQYLMNLIKYYQK